MNNKIVLIDPVECHQEGDYQRINISTNYSGTSIGIRDPLGIEYISGYLKEEGFDVDIIVKNNLSDMELVDILAQKNPYIVGFSVWTYMFKRVLEIACLIKQRLPNVYIILGGYHPSYNPDVVKYNEIDFVSVGEGEETICELAKVLKSDFTEDDLKSIKGISYLNSMGEVIITEPRPRLDFNKLPFPDRPEHIVRLSKITGLTNPSPENQISPLQISFSRGCPNKCNFCPSGALWRNKIQYRDPDVVIDEILHLQEKYKTNYVYFSDLTFNLDVEKVAELCNRIIERNVNISWSAMVKIEDHFEKNQKVFDLMKKSGCTRLAFGVEGFDENNSATRC